MKNKSVGKKIGTILSVISALAVAVLFWLVVKYIDSGALAEYAFSGIFGGVL